MPITYPIRAPIQFPIFYPFGGDSGATPSWQIIGQYGEAGFNNQSIGAGNERTLEVYPINLAVDCTQLAVLSSAFYISGASVPTAVGNDLAVTHGWVVNGANVQADASPVAVPNGSGATLTSTLLASTASLTKFDAGSRVILIREVDVPSGGGIFGGTLPYTDGAVNYRVGRASSNLSTSQKSAVYPTGLAVSGSWCNPRAVIGLGVHGYTHMVLGDSIAYQNNDTNAGDGGAIGVSLRTAVGGAHIRRAFMLASAALGRTIPLQMTVRPSATLAGLQGVPTPIRAVYPYVSVLEFEIGTNDINAGTTAAQLKVLVEAEIAAHYAAFTAANPGITPNYIVHTILPRQSTPTGTVSKPEIIAYNAYVRSGAIVGSTGYRDSNRAVAQAADESIWADGATDSADGTHPTTAGHAKIADYNYQALTFATPWLAFGQALTIAGTPGAATVGSYYYFRPMVIGGALLPRTYALTGSLPAGLSFSTTTGEITGFPTSAGTTTGLSIQATDSGGSVTLSGLSITVSAAFNPATVTSLSSGWDSRVGVTHVAGAATSWAGAYGTSNTMTLNALPAYANNVLNFTRTSSQYGNFALFDKATVPGAFEVWCLISQKTTANLQNLLGWGGGTSTYINLATDGAGLSARALGSAAITVPYPATLVANTMYAMRIVYKAATGVMSVSLNGNAGPEIAIGSGGLKLNQLGRTGGTYLDALIGPLILFNAQLSTADAANLQEYFNGMAAYYNANGTL